MVTRNRASVDLLGRFFIPEPSESIDKKGQPGANFPGMQNCYPGRKFAQRAEKMEWANDNYHRSRLPSLLRPLFWRRLYGKMQRVIGFALMGLVVTGLTPALSAQSSSTRAYLVADQQSGYILAASAPNQKVQVASLTKIATAMVVLDWAEVHRQDLSQVTVIPQSALTVGGVNPIGLAPGDQISLRDLIYCALLQSDNVAAHTLASHVGSQLKQLQGGAGVHQITNTDYFVRQMNALAKKLGMTKTLFLNPSGLDSVEKPYSTAADLGRLTRYAMSDAGFRFYVSQKERKIAVTRAGQVLECLLKNTNDLLGTDEIDGVKTGQTAKAGGCVVISAARSVEIQQTGEVVKATPRRLIVVVLGASDRFGVARSLLVQGWSRYDSWAAQGRPVNKKDTL